MKNLFFVINNFSIGESIANIQTLFLNRFILSVNNICHIKLILDSFQWRGGGGLQEEEREELVDKEEGGNGSQEESEKAHCHCRMSPRLLLLSSEQNEEKEVWVVKYTSTTVAMLREGRFHRISTADGESIIRALGSRMTCKVSFSRPGSKEAEDLKYLCQLLLVDLHTLLPNCSIFLLTKYLT